MWHRRSILYQSEAQPIFTENARWFISILIGSILFVAGLALAAIATLFTGTRQAFTANVGLGLIVAGAVAVLQDLFITRLRREDMQAGFGRITDLLKGTGTIRMLASERRNYPGYHKWLLETAPQQMFFAGRSVLHRIQLDLNRRRFGSVAEALKWKLSEGSTIRILFLDPTWDFLDRIAEAEGRNPKSLRADLATTLGICKELWDVLGKEPDEYSGDIEIRTYTELNEYAYHCVNCRAKNEFETLAGFYFAGRVGISSPLFTVVDRNLQTYFEEHFLKVFERAKPLLRCEGHGPKEFDVHYYLACRSSLTQYVGKEIVDERCPDMHVTAGGVPEVTLPASNSASFSAKVSDG